MSFIKRNFYAAALGLILVMALTGIALAGARGSFAPLNPDFVKYQEMLKSDASQGKKPVFETANGLPLGYRPSPVNLGHLSNIPLFNAVRAGKTSFPSSYDLRTLGRVSPVKDQNPYGTCWAFAATGSVESGLMPKENPDFSEWYLAYFAFTGDEGFSTDADPVFDAGGDDFIATAVLSRWMGPVNESDCPYNGNPPTGREPVQKHLQDVLYMGNMDVPYPRPNIDNMKYACMTYGALSIGVYADDAMAGYGESENWNPDTSAYYYTTPETANHAVLVVGWDDAYPKGNFKTTPPGDGAWIVKNSWGTDWGDEGYFYMSYYDNSIDTGAAYIMEPTNNYSAIYYYDPLGWLTSFGYEASDTAWMANVFTAKNADPISAVSFYTASPNASYEIYVYTDVTGGPTMGDLMSGPQSGVIEAPGYHTIKLDEPADVEQGTIFSVVVKLTTPNYEFPIPVEFCYEGYSDNAKASPGQSYVSSNGKVWEDMVSVDPSDNVCLKAFSGTKSIIKGGAGCNAGASNASFLLALAGCAIYLLRKW